MGSKSSKGSKKDDGKANFPTSCNISTRSDKIPAHFKPMESVKSQHWARTSEQISYKDVTRHPTLEHNGSSALFNRYDRFEGEKQTGTVDPSLNELESRYELEWYAKSGKTGQIACGQKRDIQNVMQRYQETSTRLSYSRQTNGHDTVQQKLPATSNYHISTRTSAGEWQSYSKQSIGYERVAQVSPSPSVISKQRISTKTSAGEGPSYSSQSIGYEREVQVSPSSVISKQQVSTRVSAYEGLSYSSQSVGYDTVAKVSPSPSVICKQRISTRTSAGVRLSHSSQSVGHDTVTQISTTPSYSSKSHTGTRNSANEGLSNCIQSFGHDTITESHPEENSYGYSDRAENDDSDDDDDDNDSDDDDDDSYDDDGDDCHDREVEESNDDALKSDAVSSDDDYNVYYERDVSIDMTNTFDSDGEENARQHLTTRSLNYQRPSKEGGEITTESSFNSSMSRDVLVNISLPAAVDWAIVYNDLKRVAKFPNFKLLSDLKAENLHKRSFCVSFTSRKKARYAMFLIKRRRKKIEAVFCENLIQMCQNNIQNERESVLGFHNKRAEEITQKLKSLQAGNNRKHNKRGFCSLDEFEKRKATKEMLKQTAKELNNQSKEFVHLTTELLGRVEQLRHTCQRDITVDLKDIERRFQREKDRFASALPIYAEKTRIIETIKTNQVCIILGETGSGKSTQLVQYLYDAGFAENKSIVCTQPRKVAAFSLAKRVSEELLDNRLVDCMDGAKKCSIFSKIFFTTDHSLLMKCLKDRELSSCSCVVIDEAHERNIDTDLLLGIVKKALPKRPDLRVVVTSATIDPTLFQNYFGGCPVIRVSGKLFPVELEWKKSQYGNDYVYEAVEKVVEIERSNEAGDVLVFLTCPAEIDRALEMLPKRINTSSIMCLPLHGKLLQEHQRKVFDSTPDGKRKVVFSTNCAETSLTIPGIKFVIDSGRAKEMRYDQKRNLSSLEIAMVSQSSANQRKGRAGRTDSGKCFRLYTEEQFKALEKASKPEILRVHLGQAILKLMELGVNNPAEFDYVESPSVESIKAALMELEELGAIEEGELSELGKNMARLPLETRLGKFLFEGLSKMVGYEALVLVSIATITGSVFFRMGTGKEKEEADNKKMAFCQLGGDFMTLLEVFRKWLDVDERDRGRWCYSKGLNAKAMRMANETVKDLKIVLQRDLHINNIQWAAFDREQTDRILQKTIFSCFLSKLCVFAGHEKAGYQTVVGNHILRIHRASAVKFMGNYPTLVVYEKILKTSQDFMVNVTPVEKTWLIETINDPGLLDTVLQLMDNQMVKRTVSRCSDALIEKCLSPLREKMPLLESLVSKSCNGLPVVVELESQNATLDVFISSQYAERAEEIIKDFLESGKSVLREATSEHHVENATGLRVVIESGLTVKQVLTQGMYRTVFSYYANESLHEFLRSKGKVNISVTKEKQWTFATYEDPQGALRAVEDAKKHDFFVLPKKDKAQQGQGNFSFLVTVKWLRREPKGMANVAFNEEPAPWADLPLSWSKNVMIGSKQVRVTADKYRPDSIFLNNLKPSSTKQEIKQAVEQIFPGTSVSESSISIQYKPRDVNGISTQIQRRILEKAIARHALSGLFEVSLKEFHSSNDKCPFASALVKFEKPHEGIEVFKRLQNKSLEGLEKWPVTLDVRPKLDFYQTCLQNVYDLVKGDIQKQISKISYECQVNCADGLKLKEEPMGKTANSTSARLKLFLETNCLEHFIQASNSITRAIQGESFDCTKPKERLVLLTPGGKDKLSAIQKETGALIFPDVRTASLVIHGTGLHKQQAIYAIDKFILDIVSTDSTIWVVNLKGNNKPRGLLKQVLSVCGSNLEKLLEIDGVVKIKKCIFKHALTIESSTTAKEKVIQRIKEIERSLASQLDRNEAPEIDTEDCPICLCKVNNVYRMSTCSHAYCTVCVLQQIKGSADSFPMKCAVLNCEEKFTTKDMEKLLGDKKDLNKIVKQSLDAYMGAHPDKARHCPSADCPMVYLVTEGERQFRCNVCSTATCSACHKPYHLGMTCKEYEIAVKDRGGEEFEEWIREKPSERKRCPSCTRPIERNEGCNHMYCRKCKGHFCWVCLKLFKTESDVYRHQRDCNEQR